MKQYHDDSLAMIEYFPGATVRFIHSDNITLSEWIFQAGIDLPEHSHSNEQITKLIAGEFELTIDGEVILLKPGSTVIIPPNVVHSGRAIAKSHLIDVFHPVREDFKASQYLKT